MLCYWYKQGYPFEGSKCKKIIILPSSGPKTTVLGSYTVLLRYCAIQQAMASGPDFPFWRPKTTELQKLFLPFWAHKKYFCFHRWCRGCELYSRPQPRLPIWRIQVRGGDQNTLAVHEIPRQELKTAYMKINVSVEYFCSPSLTVNFKRHILPLFFLS